MASASSGIQKVVVTFDAETKALIKRLIAVVEKQNAKEAAKAAESVPVKKEPEIPASQRGNPYNP